MGSTLIKGDSGQNEPQTELNLILKSIGNEVNIILQNQNKNLESIRQSLKEQTNYLKNIAHNMKKPSTQFSQTKVGHIKNQTSQKSIQLGQQSSNVSLQSKQTIKFKESQIKESPEQNQCLQQKQKEIIEQKKPSKMNQMLTQIPQLYFKKRSEIYSRIQKIQMTLKDQLHLQKNDSILFINKNSNQLQKTRTQKLLDNHEKNQGNIDYKDRFIIMPLVNYPKYQNINMMMDPWISDLYEKLSEEAFYGYLHKHMTNEQMKVFFSQNLILNTVKMMRSLTQNNKNTSVKQILKKFVDISDSVLEFQLKKYPQKKKPMIKSQIQTMVQLCQIYEDSQYDILRNMKFRYQYNQNGVYYREIKLMINKIISLINQHFQSYQEQMKKIFTLKQQKQIPEYIQHQIGRKINQNTPQFEQHQINSNKITLQSPQIMRIIIKWIQELEDKIQNLAKNIENRYYPFPLRDGGSKQYSKYDLEDISKRFKQYLSQPKQQLYKNLQMLQNIESQMMNYIETNSKSFTFLSQNDIDIGLTTHLLSETVQQIAIKRLNQVIHSILSFENQQRKQQEFGKVIYITFSIYDLLRSRCTGNYQNIKMVYDQLKKNDNFKIIRVKNRLETGNRDFLINMKFKNTPIICELQLGLILETSINQKQDRLSDFNHFLYQLKRSKYGPLTQAVMFNVHYSQTINFFQQKIKKIKFQKERKMIIQSIKPKICNNEIQIPGHEISVEQIIFVCHNCLQIKYTKTSFLNTYKKMKRDRDGQFQYLCGECVVNSLQIFDKNKYLLGEYTDQYFQQTNQDEILINNKVQEIFYYLIISTNRSRYIVRKLEEDYFIQCFSTLVSQKYQFLKIDQLDIKYVYRLAKQVNNYKNIIKIHNIQELNQGAYINQQKRELLINNNQKWKQAVCIEGNKGYLLIDATKQQDSTDYKFNLNLFIKTNQIKKLKQSKLQYMDLGLWRVNQEFFQINLKEVKQINKLNLSYNNLTDISQIIKGKNILQLKLNYNKLQSVTIPVQSLIILQISNNKLVDIDVSALINLQILDISQNKITNVKLDKLVKLHKLNLYSNQLREDRCIGLDKLVKLQKLDLSLNYFEQLTLTNKQCQKLYLSATQLVKIEISKIEKLKRLLIGQNHFEKLVLENPSLEILDINGSKSLKEINIQKLVNLKELRMERNNIQNLTLNNSKLQYLDISSNQLTSVNFKTVVSLKHLYLNQNKLQQLFLDYPLLETLYVNKNQLQKLDLSKLVNLKKLYANQNELTQFPEIDLKSLQILDLKYNKLKNINLNGFHNLREVDIRGNLIDEFIVDNLDLQKIDARGNKINKVDITKLNKIRHIDFNHNKIQQIVLENKSLQTILLQYNRIRNINVDKLSNLTKLNIKTNLIKNINIDKLSSLKQLNISNNFINSINIKKQNNPKLNQIFLNNSKFMYVNYFIEHGLTEQQKVRYEQQRYISEAYDIQILNKLGIIPIITNESLQGIIQSIKKQYSDQIDIQDRVSQF